MTPLCPEVVLLSGRDDLACDYVAAELRRRGARYLRLNTEDLASGHVVMDPRRRVLEGRVGDCDFTLTALTLKATYFRRSTFLRSFAVNQATPAEQFTKTQWSAFTRAFMIFDDCRWMNHPARTYVAENKAIQISEAARLKFDIPFTVVTNSVSRGLADAPKTVALKGLDPVHVRDTDGFLFGYTSIVDREELRREDLSTAPAIIQEALARKLDLRVTVVGQRVFAVSVTDQGGPVDGDWRPLKDRATFGSVSLPAPVAQGCIAMLNRLGLSFGGFDFAVVDGRYFFLEVNPTGEWAWLVDALGLPIADAIVAYLLGEHE